MMGVKSLWILSVDRLHARPHPDPAWRLGCESCDLRDREVEGPRSKEGELWGPRPGAKVNSVIYLQE